MAAENFEPISNTRASRRSSTRPLCPPPSTAGSASTTSTSTWTPGPLTCPEGVTVALNKRDQARFGANCAACPLRPMCTKARKGRVIQVDPHHRLLSAARRQVTTTEFQDEYRQDRPMVERTLAWLVLWHLPQGPLPGHHQISHLWWAHRCAVVNLTRLVNLGLTTTPQEAWDVHRIEPPNTASRPLKTAIHKAFQRNEPHRQP